MVLGRPSHVAIAPLLCPNGVVVELKRRQWRGEKERREKVVSRPPFCDTLFFKKNRIL
jgi:hypothetical protein